MGAKRKQQTARKASEKASYTSGQDEYATFSDALKRVLTVSHEEMKTQIKRASSARASRAKH